MKENLKRHLLFLAAILTVIMCVSCGGEEENEPSSHCRLVVTPDGEICEGGVPEYYECLNDSFDDPERINALEESLRKLSIQLIDMNIQLVSLRRTMDGFWEGFKKGAKAGLAPIGLDGVIEYIGEKLDEKAIKEEERFRDAVKTIRSAQKAISAAQTELTSKATEQRKKDLDAIIQANQFVIDSTKSQFKDADRVLLELQLDREKLLNSESSTGSSTKTSWCQ